MTVNDLVDRSPQLFPALNMEKDALNGRRSVDHGECRSMRCFLYARFICVVPRSNSRTSGQRSGVCRPHPRSRAAAAVAGERPGGRDDVGVALARAVRHQAASGRQQSLVHPAQDVPVQALQGGDINQARQRPLAVPGGVAVPAAALQHRGDPGRRSARPGSGTGRRPPGRPARGSTPRGFGRTAKVPEPGAVRMRPAAASWPSAAEDTMNSGATRTPGTDDPSGPPCCAAPTPVHRCSPCTCDME